jgi:hypothetical protein
MYQIVGISLLASFFGDGNICLWDCPTYNGSGWGQLITGGLIVFVCLRPQLLQQVWQRLRHSLEEADKL